jgi:predicted nucleic-acid-binding Zn-ribbon protein
LRRRRTLPNVSIFSPKTFASIGDRKVECVFCGADQFDKREIKLNTTGMELLDLGWANSSATGLECLSCGFVHTFTSKVRMWEDDPAA